MPSTPGSSMIASNFDDVYEIKNFVPSEIEKVCLEKSKQGAEVSLFRKYYTPTRKTKTKQKQKQKQLFLYFSSPKLNSLDQRRE